MKAFFDERCLSGDDLPALLRLWRQIADFATSNAEGLSIFLDQNATRSGAFLSRFNELRSDHRVLYTQMLFGSGLVKNWRLDAIAGEALCQLSTEDALAVDCAVCEAYEHRKSMATIAILGDQNSSFSARSTVTIAKIEPPEPGLDVACGACFVDFQRIGRSWNGLRLTYDRTSRDPPRDAETVLLQRPDRFERVGRFELNGRRQVYCEVESGRLFYVDNLHYGASAHIEVFDAQERHIGVATLDGEIDFTAAKPERSISW
jgi:hypothetical protein